MTTYYVSGTGNDRNSGLSQGGAFATLQRAGDLVLPGDNVYIMNGTYTSIYANILSIVNKQGTANAPITFAALPGQTPVLQANGKNWNAISITGSTYIKIQGLKLVGNRDNITLAYAQQQKNNLSNPATSGNGISADVSSNNPNQHSSHITISNNNVSNFPGGGIATLSADYITVQNNIVSGNAWYSPYGTQGISMLRPWNSDSNTTGYKIIIQGNTVFNNQSLIPWSAVGKITEGHGIMLDSASDGNYIGKVLITNNFAYNNGGAGIQVFKGENPVDVVNNTLYQNSQVIANGELFLNSAKNVQVYNNILYGNQGEFLILNNKSTNLTIDNNLADKGVFNAIGAGNILNQDPLFVNPTNGNFSLQPGSPAINAGSNAFNSITGDGTGTASVNIGAYQLPTSKSQVLNGTSNTVNSSTTVNTTNTVNSSTTVNTTLDNNLINNTFPINNITIPTFNLNNFQLLNQSSLVGTLPTSPASLTSYGILLLAILARNIFRAFLKGYFLMQCEKPESRFYKALKFVVRNPGKSPTEPGQRHLNIDEPE
ncbi:MAG: right-handed parallel beta-helix repeat-containing protein [Nostoc sp.]|uniref:right-handed parallel beta-helix repeat-containing protein n=1 Tax=Nostoc sp. TaxID=1180 RepID=UPI002FF80783